MDTYNLLSENIFENIFQTKSSLVEFVVIQEEFNSLFEFCISFQAASLNKLKTLNKEKESIDIGPDRLKFDNNFELNKDELLMGLTDFVIPNWNDIIEFTVPMNQVILSYIFLERSLKLICSEYSMFNQSNLFGEYKCIIKLKRNESTIKGYLRYLNENCNIKIGDLPDSINFVDSEIRNLRNAYVHGDWDSCKNLIKVIKVNDVFISISNLIETVEECCIKLKAEEKKKD